MLQQAPQERPFSSSAQQGRPQFLTRIYIHPRNNRLITLISQADLLRKKLEDGIKIKKLCVRFMAYRWLICSRSRPCLAVLHRTGTGKIRTTRHRNISGHTSFRSDQRAFFSRQLSDLSVIYDRYIAGRIHGTGRFMWYVCVRIILGAR